MTLNASGPISLAGTTTGQSIEIELGGTGTTQISLNDANVRTLAGVASGAITMPTNFYGKSATSYTTGLFYAGATGTAASTYSNYVTRINACGALIGTESTLAGTGNGRISVGGARMGNNAGFYAGVQYLTNQKQSIRINKCGSLVGVVSNIGSYCNSTAFNGGANACTQATYVQQTTTGTTAMTRLNNCGALISQNCGVDPLYTNQAGASAGSLAVFYGGTCCVCCVPPLPRTRRVNKCGALVGSITNVGTGTGGSAGAQIGGNAVYYAGSINCDFFTPTNCVLRINVCGALVGSVTTVSTARLGHSGARVCSVGVYYGGAKTSTTRTNEVVRINACGALVGTVGTLGTARTGIAGAGI